jgi:hypothetical protein
MKIWVALKWLRIVTWQDFVNVVVNCRLPQKWGPSIPSVRNYTFFKNDRISWSYVISYRYR